MTDRGVAGGVGARGLALALSFALAACTTTEPATQVRVHLVADDVVTNTAALLRVNVSGFARGESVPSTTYPAVYAASEGPLFPRVVTIAPLADDATRTFELEVHAVARGPAGDTVLSIARARSGFLAHRSIELRVLLVAGCMCPAGLTCDERGACVDAGMPMPLPDGGVPDGAVATDAGTSWDAGPPPACTGTGPCDDGNACTEGEACVGGLCTGGTARSCDDGDPCNGLEVCVPPAGCAAGTPRTCSDGVTCTRDTCVPGAGCTSTPDDTLCPSGNGRHCDADLGCQYEDCAATCMPISACETATCDAGGACVRVPLCDDDNPCTIDECTAGGCRHVRVGGAPCDDHNACTENDRCVVGVCWGDEIPCGLTEPSACRFGYCSDGMCMVAYTTDTAHCVPPDACVLAAQCIAGECQPVALVDCPMGTACNPADGRCR